MTLQLYIYDDKKQMGHYAWIRNFSGFMCDQLNSCEHKLYYCNKCLHHFYNKKDLDKHSKLNCTDINSPASIEFPEPEKAFIGFKNHINKFRCPFIIYADL